MPHVYITRNAIGSYRDHQFQVGGDAGYMAGFDPIRRRLWRFGADDTDEDRIQWADIDTWYTGTSHTTTPIAGGGCVWHEQLQLFFLYGGRYGGDVTRSADCYSFDPATHVLTLLSETLEAPRNSVSACYCPNNGLVYLFGGSIPNTDVIYVHNPYAGTITNTTALLPQAQAGQGAVWAEDVERIFIISGSDQTTDYPSILTYNPASPATDPVDTGVDVSVQGRENLHGAYVNGSIYIFGGYSYEEHTYYDLIERITTNGVACTTLAQTCWRADDDAVAFYDPVTEKIYCGPWIHSSQAVDNNGPDKRMIMEFDVATEQLIEEPALL